MPHTPGPWKYQRDGRSFALTGKPGWNPDDPSQCGHNVYHSTGKICILTDRQYRDSDEQIAADARLIAAAPMLLEALVNVLAAYRDSINGPEVDAARKAVSLARGI